jgi:hypothetical protein
MVTNVIAYLHTTFAYQSAAMQLMVAQANFDAQQLHLREPLPIVVPSNTNDWNVAMPPDGVAGTLTTSNYIYQFTGGRLLWIQIKTPPRSATELQTSLIDTNGAYQLARQWLEALSVDVAALESKYPHIVKSSAAPPALFTRGNIRTADPAPKRPGGTNNVRRVAPVPPRPPVFRVSWGGSDPQSASNRTPTQVSMEILGSAKQCLSLHISNPNLLRNPPLQVTNAAALLGPLPAPQHFVEEFLGGKAAYDTVVHPDHVQIWLLGGPPGDLESKANRTPAIEVDAATAAAVSRTLTDFNSYSWLEEKGCQPDYSVRLRFTKGTEIVDFAWCYQCDHLQVIYNGRSTDKDCDAARSALAKAIQSAFPKDEIVKEFGQLNPNK